jgi:CheY-like chemotaxis protein
VTLRVFLIENDPIVRLDLVEVLREAGFEVDHAANGREALERLRKAPIRPELILLDLRTPEMDGWDFRREQTADGALGSIPVVLVSGDPDIAAHARRLNAAGYLRKPFGLDSLLRVVRSLSEP